MNIVDKLTDLHKQATTERSHYYVGSVCTEASTTINDLVLACREAKTAIVELLAAQKNKRLAVDADRQSRSALGNIRDAVERATGSRP